MESISSTKMFQKSEYKENGKIIRWTEVRRSVSNLGQRLAVSCLYIDLCLCLAQVFFLQRASQPKGGASDSAEHNRLMERIARAFCLALCPHLKLLKEDGMAKLGLRVAFQSQEVSAAAWCDIKKALMTEMCLFKSHSHL